MKISDVGHSAKDDDRNEFLRTSQWECCRLSNKKLELPIVSDYKGHLFNKEAILEWLLTPDREDYSQNQIEKFSHIRKLDDVVELRNLSQVSDSHEGFSLRCDYNDTKLGQSASRLVYLVPCGDVLPVTSLSISSSRRCPKCDQQYQELDVITINPSAKDALALEKRMQKIKDTRHHNNSTRKRLKRKRQDDKASRIKKMK